MKTRQLVFLLIILMGIGFLYSWVTEPTTEEKALIQYRETFITYCQQEADVYGYCESNNFFGFIQQYHPEMYESLKEVNDREQ